MLVLLLILLLLLLLLAIVVVAAVLQQQQHNLEVAKESAVGSTGTCPPLPYLARIQMFLACDHRVFTYCTILLVRNVRMEAVRIVLLLSMKMILVCKHRKLTYHYQ